MLGSFFITEIRGVPIRLHFTALFLIPWIFAQVPNLLVTLIICVLILGSVGLHELGHTIVSQRYGVDVQDIILTPVGGVARLRGLPDDPRHEIRIALAGPYVSLFLAVASFILTLGVTRLGLTSFPFGLLAVLNLMLFLFNLLPSFPMDGGRVLRGVLSQKMGALEATRIAAKTGKIMCIGFIVLGLATNNFSLVIIGIIILTLSGSEYRMMRMKHWHEQQTGGQTADPSGAHFTAGPPPYASSQGPHVPDNLLGDVLLTFRDLYQETMKTLFTPRS